MLLFLVFTSDMFAKEKSTINFLCSQGPGGSFSHSCGAYQHSYDFQCPIGTPVIAPRSGIILDVCDTQTESGPDLKYEQKCNYVTIYHSDGTQCDLVHLKYQGVVVGKGDRVAAGELIGYSGNTGFSGEPHVHMMVYVSRLVPFKNELHVRWQTIPVKYVFVHV